jgi:protein-disulfide isomerase
LIDEYVASGDVRLEYHDLAFLGDESTRAAEAAACALDQGAFWPYHDTLFLNQDGENRGAFTDDRLRQTAAAVDLDEEAFDTCLDDGTHRGDIEQMTEEARQQGITSTPSVVVNGQLLDGWDFGTLESAIAAELDAAS